MSYTICWEIRKTQQPQKRFHLEKQYTNIKNDFNIEGHNFNMQNLYLQNNLNISGQINSSKMIENWRKFLNPKVRNTKSKRLQQRIE